MAVGWSFSVCLRFEVNGDGLVVGRLESRSSGRKVHSWSSQVSHPQPDHVNTGYHDAIIFKSL